MSDNPPTTVLVLSGQGVPLYSARGLKQTLEPINAAFQLKRTVNGDIVNIAPSQMLKYKSTITGDDQEAPALDGIWQSGRIVVTVDCIAELAYLTQGGTPDRTVVPDSSYIELDWTFYRPRLTMLVAGFSIEKDEWGAQTAWRLDLEEKAS